ncbi:glycosyltransferase family 4 protein [Metabacillus indicus]|uniref:glycosyltransferase family 4 protein n=1 Tax=Metabacillus indicus TaxID=246786 RepID=UPI003CEC075A
MKKILILANHFITIYAFRRELIRELLEQGYEVHLALPESDENNYFATMGCKIINTPLDRRSTNPISDLKLLFQYIKIIKSVKPDLILTYTIKPNTYGGIAAMVCRANVMHTVTGLGSVYIQDLWQKNIAVILNKIAFKSALKVVFLNEDNKIFYKNLGIISSKHDTMIVPGSGVNIENFKFAELPEGDKTTFSFVGRILKDKGIEEYISAASDLISLYKNVEFEVIGFVDEEKYVDLLSKYEQEGVIKYLGKRNDIPNIMKKSSCIVLPSYGEGRGTVLQEGAAVGRPLITCNTYGCRENVEDQYNGYLCEIADAKSLKDTMEKFINLPKEEKALMGRRSRKKAEREFDRKIVIQAYIDEIKKIVNGKG